MGGKLVHEGGLNMSRGCTNLSDSFKTDCVPHFLGYGGKDPLINLGDVETLASCDVVVPLASNLGLICD